jgi:hypothetical protein
MTGHSREEASEYLAAARLGLDKWDLFLNLDLKDWPDATTALRTASLLGPDRSEGREQGVKNLLKPCQFSAS